MQLFFIHVEWVNYFLYINHKLVNEHPIGQYPTLGYRLKDKKYLFACALFMTKTLLSPWKSLGMILLFLLLDIFFLLCFADRKKVGEFTLEQTILP